MFHPLDGLSVQEQQAANVREFTGDGTPFLKVPGLKDQPTSVRLGHTVMPMTIKQKFPTAVPNQFEEFESPLYIVLQQADGMPILLRSQQSNDGVWQKDVPIFVQGDWEEGSEATSVSNTSEVEDLRAQLAEMEKQLARAKLESDAKAKAEADAAAAAGKK